MSITLNKPGARIDPGSASVFVARWRGLLAGLDEPASTVMEDLVAQTLAGNADAPMTLAITALVAAHARLLQRTAYGNCSLGNAESVLAAAEALSTAATTLITGSR